MGQLAYAIIAGIVVFLLALLLLPLLSLPVTPWAALLGVLAGIVTYFGAPRRV